MSGELPFRVREPTDEKSAAALEALTFVPPVAEAPQLDPRQELFLDQLEARIVAALSGRKAAKS